MNVVRKIKMIFLTGLMFLGGMIGMANVSAEEGNPFAAENFSATMTFTTDYTFRGTTFSDRDPALQGSFDWGYGSFFAGAWGSSTNATDDNMVGGTLEVDFYVGWADAVGGFDLMVMPLLYVFPGQNGSGARNDTTFELWTSIGHSLEGMLGSPYVNVAVNWSPDYFDHVTYPDGGSALYIKPSVSFALAENFGVDFAYGYQDVGGLGANDFFLDDYAHIEIGVTSSLLGFGLDLRYHNNLDENVIGQGFALGDKIVFSISRSF